MNAEDVDLSTGVSYVMPVLNDVQHVRQAVESLLAQDHTFPFEIILAVGVSIDGTHELVEQLSQRDRRIIVLDNPVGSTPAGLNIAIKHSSYPVIIRVDAHSFLPSDYTRIAVQTLQETGADNVGGLMDAQGVTSFEQAVAAAYTSYIGLGGTKLHVGGEAGSVDTVYLGVFRKTRLFEVGLFDENIKRGQDWELNRRLRKSGGTIWFTPKLKVTYRPRSKLSSLGRQFLSTGIWRGELTRRFRSSGSLRYFVPPLAVTGICLGLLVSVTSLVYPAWFGSLLMFGLAIPALYLVFVCVGVFILSRALSLRASMWLFLVITCIHFAWGIGFLLGYFALTKNITQHVGR